jgi:hypothetical protein
LEGNAFNLADLALQRFRRNTHSGRSLRDPAVRPVAKASEE